MARKLVRKSKGGTTKIKSYQEGGKVSVSKTKKNPKTNEYGWVEGSSIKHKKVSSKRAERMKKRGWREDMKMQKGGKTREERVSENLKIKEMKADSKNKRRVKSASSKAIADNMLKNKKDNRAKRTQETAKAVRTKKKTVNRTGSMKVVGDDVKTTKIKTNINSKNKSKSTTAQSGSQAASKQSQSSRSSSNQQQQQRQQSQQQQQQVSKPSTPRPKPKRRKATIKTVKSIERKQKGGSTSRSIKGVTKKHQTTNPGKRKSGKQYRRRAGK